MQNGIAQILRSLESFLGGHDGMPCGTRDAAASSSSSSKRSRSSAASMLSAAGAEDAYAHSGEVLCKLDSGLTAELNYHAVRLLGLDDSFNVLLGQRVEVQSVAGVEVGGNGLGVVVDR